MNPLPQYTPARSCEVNSTIELSVSLNNAIGTFQQFIGDGQSQLAIGLEVDHELVHRPVRIVHPRDASTSFQSGHRRQTH